MFNLSFQSKRGFLLVMEEFRTSSSDIRPMHRAWGVFCQVESRRCEFLRAVANGTARLNQESIARRNPEGGDAKIHRTVRCDPYVGVVGESNDAPYPILSPPTVIPAYRDEDNEMAST